MQPQKAITRSNKMISTLRVCLRDICATYACVKQGKQSLKGNLCDMRQLQCDHKNVKPDSVKRYEKSLK